MDQLKLKELILKIETLRNYMHELIYQNELKDPQILEVSQQLDKLLVKYYKLIKGKC